MLVLDVMPQWLLLSSTMFMCWNNWLMYAEVSQRQVHNTYSLISTKFEGADYYFYKIVQKIFFPIFSASAFCVGSRK